MKKIKQKTAAAAVLLAAMTACSGCKISFDDSGFTIKKSDDSDDYAYTDYTIIECDISETDQINSDDSGVNLFSPDDTIDTELFYETLYNHLNSHETQCRFTGLSDDQQDEIYSMTSDYLSEHTEFFWYDKTVQSCYMNPGGILDLTFNIREEFKNVDLDETIKKFEDKVDSIIKNVDPMWSTYEKVKYIHDYLSDNTYYEKKALEDETLKNTVSTPYECLVNGRAICNSYASSFKLLAERLGVESGVVTGETDNDGHAWNYVKINDEYYWLDVTWDDNDITNTDYYYFLLNDELFLQGRIPDNNGQFVPECKSMKENYYVKNNLYFEKYSFDEIEKVINEHSNDSSVSFMFSSGEELEKCSGDLFDASNISNVSCFSNGCNISYVKNEELNILKINF